MKRNKIITTVLAVALLAGTGASAYAANNIIPEYSGKFTESEFVKIELEVYEPGEMPVTPDYTFDLNSIDFKSIGGTPLIEVPGFTIDVKTCEVSEMPEALHNFQTFTINAVEK